VVPALAIGAVGMAGPLLLLHLVSPAAMGWGDVKLAFVLGSALASVDVRLGIAALALASAATLIGALVAGRVAVPFAPGLVAGAAALLATVSTTGLDLPR
jgi:leader peptidase (prepilin peptidase)/N-methyltransferase